MKNRTLLSLLVATLILLGSSFTDQLPLLSSDDRTNNQQVKLIIPDLPQQLFHEGMITIKVKEGFGEIMPQKGAVVFDHPEMDELVAEFKIHEVSKRFRHRPIPKESGLPDLSRIYKISFPEKHNIVEVVTAFSKLKEIEYAEPIPFATLCEVPDDPYFSIQQHLPQIMAVEAWDIHHGESGTEEIVVGINDTGVDWDHPDLVDNIWQNLGEDADGDGHVMENIGGEWVFDPGDINGIDDDASGFVDDFIGWDYYMDDNDVNPNPGSQSLDHGSHCAGIAAGRTNNGIGIASVSWNIKIFSTQTDDGEFLTWGYDGIIYAAEMGIDISSNSWASWLYSRAEEEAIAYATGLGTIVVAAAGNQETNMMTRYPAGYPGVISAASVSVDDTKADYSNWGKWVDISAPGGGSEGGIFSTYNNGGYGNMSGTSMATPMVAGLFGLVKSYNPTWSNDELIVQVMGTADDIDNLNPGLENQLGSGRINAFRALSETNVSGPEELRLEFISASPEDNNGNGLLEQGELVNIDLKMWNRCPASTSTNTTFTISCDDPDIILLQHEVSGTVPYDSYFTLDDAFQFQISNDATPHVAEISLDISSDIDITYGDHFKFYLPIMASGALVFEGQEGGDSYSGQYISEFFSNLDIDHVYTPGFPETFTGYDMAFLSFGNWSSYSGTTWITPNMSDILTCYLENGGKVYTESSELFGFFEQRNLYLMGLFGVGFTWDGPNSQNRIHHLEGQPNALTQEMLFTESNQLQNYYIDLYETAGSGQAAFVQDEDTLAVQNEGDSLQKTFIISYSVAELVDNSPQNSRFNLLYKVLDFLDYDFGEGFVIANFNADTLQGGPTLPVYFYDWSIYDTTTEITSWEWDFNGDGEIDSWDQDTYWEYDTPGQYTVSLTVSTAFDTNTITREKYIWVNEGVLVFEGVSEGPDYSGTFIKDYLDNINVDADYTTNFPPGLIGYDAVFLSFGNIGSGKTLLTGPIVDHILQYLQSGGRCYIEGGDCIVDGRNTNNQFPQYFSILVQIGGNENSIDSLGGNSDALTYDMLFSSSTQTSFESIDKMVPASTGIAAFKESDYFIVAVQGEGENYQKTFCFSYTLAALQDGEYPSTREELLTRICTFFDIILSDEEKFLDDDGLDMVVYPNPANNNVNLIYHLVKPAYVSVEIYDISGVFIDQSLNVNQTEGEHQLAIDVSDLSPGIYILKLQTGIKLETKKIVILD